MTFQTLGFTAVQKPLCGGFYALCITFKFLLKCFSLFERHQELNSTHNLLRKPFPKRCTVPYAQLLKSFHSFTKIHSLLLTRSLALTASQREACRMKSLNSSYVKKKPKHFESMRREQITLLHSFYFFSDLFFILIQFGIDKQSLPQNSPWSMTTVKMILAKSFKNLHGKSLHCFQSIMVNIFKTLGEFRKQLETNAPRLYMYKEYYILVLVS